MDLAKTTHRVPETPTSKEQSYESVYKFRIRRACGIHDCGRERAGS
jgi:hypothetical protein